MTPDNYKWLDAITPPNTIKNGLKLYGTKEKVGNGNNPTILSWADECNISYATDDIPWCGLYTAVVIKRAGWSIVANPLWARNWLNFGQPATNPSLGDVLVFSRDGGGHVGFYIAEDSQYYHVLGGNQGDMVNIIRVNKNRLIGARRPIWKISKPSAVRPYIVTTGGTISENEA